MNSLREETKPPHVIELVTGHFYQSADYANFRARGTDDYLLILTLDGSGIFNFGKENLQTQRGDITLYEPGAVHDYATNTNATNTNATNAKATNTNATKTDATGVAASKGHAGRIVGWELLWAHFRPRPHWLSWLHWPPVAPGLRLLSLRENMDDFPALSRALHSAHALASDNHERGLAWGMHALEEFLLRADALNPQRQGSDPRVQDAIAYLGAHLQSARPVMRPVMLRDVAAHVSLSPSRLSFLFRAQTGMSPLAYLEAQRLHRAAQLLRVTSLNVEEVGREVGFLDPFYFSTRFKRAFGRSPRAYREELNREKPKM